MAAQPLLYFAAEAAHRSWACTAPGCSRASQRLCVLSLPGSDVLLEVCESCYLCEEVRRLAARLPEESLASEATHEGLAALYALARQSVLEQEAGHVAASTSTRAVPLPPSGDYLCRQQSVSDPFDLHGLPPGIDAGLPLSSRPWHVAGDTSLALPVP